MRLERLGGRLGLVDGDLDLGHRRLLVGLFLGPVAVEAVGGQSHAEGRPSALFGRRVGQPQHQALAARGLHGVVGVGGGQLGDAIVEFGLLAGPDNDQAGGVQAVRRDQFQGLAHGPLEPAAGDGAADQAAQGLIQRRSGR